MSDGKLGLAVIGAGMAAKPHGRALQDLQDRIAVRGVYTRNPATREAFAAAYGLPATANLDALVADPAVDAALILTPPNARLEFVRAFAAAGKHVLMEKPVERTTAAAEEIVALCEQAGVRLGIVFQNRFRAGSRRLKALAQSGALGPLHVVQADVPWWRPQDYYDEPGRGTYARDGGGVLISQAIHTLDLMLSLTGPAAEAQALAATTGFHRMESEDFVGGGIRFASGAVGSVTASTALYPGGAEALTFGFDRATARLASGVLTLSWRDGRTEQIGEPAATGGGADPMAFPHDWHRDLIAEFADAVRAGRPPEVAGRDALHVHRLIDALLRSSAEKRAVALD